MLNSFAVHCVCKVFLAPLPCSASKGNRSCGICYVYQHKPPFVASEVFQLMHMNDDHLMKEKYGRN